MAIQFPVYTFHFLYSSCGYSSKGLPASEELPVSVSTTLKVPLQPTWGHIMLKTPKVALISEYLAADLSADALCIINIGYSRFKVSKGKNKNLECSTFSF